GVMLRSRGPRRLAPGARSRAAAESRLDNTKTAPRLAAARRYRRRGGVPVALGWLPASLATARLPVKGFLFLDREAFRFAGSRRERPPGRTRRRTDLRLRARYGARVRPGASRPRGTHSGRFRPVQ